VEKYVSSSDSRQPLIVGAAPPGVGWTGCQRRDASVAAAFLVDYKSGESGVKAVGGVHKQTAKRKILRRVFHSLYLCLDHPWLDVRNINRRLLDSL